MSVTLHMGDCLDVMAGMQAGSVDAVVCDPPAGIAFMNRNWDTFKRHEFIEFLAVRMAETLRLTKPGGHALVWALPRTSHWTAMALEDAGWVIEDRIAHIFGQGFPKHKSKLKPAVEDWWLCTKPGGAKWLNVDGCRIPTNGESLDGGRISTRTEGWDRPWKHDAESIERCKERGREAVAKAESLGRWPTHVVFTHHLDCEPCGTRRVKGSHSVGDPRDGLAPGIFGNGTTHKPFDYTGPDGLETVAAWKCVEQCPVRRLDEQAGERKSGGAPARHRQRESGYNGNWLGGDVVNKIPPNDGMPSRFFPTFAWEADDFTPFRYVPKASRAERNKGLEGMPEVVCQTECGGDFPVDDQGRQRDRFKTTQSNIHPCVKPLALMKWLVRLSCPPGGTILDPFAGSGTTLLAALAEGFDAIGIEREAEYHAIAERRIAREAEQAKLFV